MLKKIKLYYLRFKSKVIILKMYFVNVKAEMFINIFIKRPLNLNNKLIRL